MIKLLWHKLYILLFAIDVKRRGVYAPILVTRDGDVLDGRSRLEAARIVGLKEIPVVVVDSSVEMMQVDKLYLRRNIRGSEVT